MQAGSLLANATKPSRVIFRIGKANGLELAARLAPLKDPALKSFAQKYLPIIQQHLQMAQRDTTKG
jgi:hypothetical protein